MGMTRGFSTCSQTSSVGGKAVCAVLVSVFDRLVSDITSSAEHTVFDPTQHRHHALSSLWRIQQCPRRSPGEQEVRIIEPARGLVLRPEYLNGSGNDGISIHHVRHDPAQP
mgnify:CR=1 FL=1